MADNRTEKPTPKRISKARDEGKVVVSEDMMSAMTLIVLTAMIALKGPSISSWAMTSIKEGLSCNTSHMSNTQAFSRFLNQNITDIMLVMMPFFAALMIAGIITNIAVSGRNFSIGAAKWKLSAVNPVNGLRQIFSAKAVVKLVFSIVKLIFISLIVYVYLKDKIDSLATFQWAWSSQFLTIFSQLILGVMIRICIGLALIGVADFAYQKWKYTKDLMMTKQQVKDEQRAKDSPPEVKHKIRQKQFEAAMRRTLQEVPKANVVLVNPTHVAVALKYDPETMPAPIVVAKGGDHLCEKIKDVARAYGVPIIRRPAIARSIYTNVEVNHIIPDSLFVAVAEVLALVYRLRNRK